MDFPETDTVGPGTCQTICHAWHLDGTLQGSRLPALTGSSQQPSELGSSISPIWEIRPLRFKTQCCSPGVSWPLLLLDLEAAQDGI